MADPFILLWFEGPLQSWGCRSRYWRRETLDFPTRSGVLGLICCARGASGEQVEWLDQMASHGQNVLCFAKKQDAGQQLTDFQMVGNGYDDKDPWQTLLIPKKADGTKPVGGGAKITYRYYLQGAAFAVILQVPEALAKETSMALESPRWDVYLGRKSCAPSDLIYRGTYLTEDQARSGALAIAGQKGFQLTREVIEGFFPDRGETMTLSDVPKQFGMHKLYADRQVTVIPCQE